MFVYVNWSVIVFLLPAAIEAEIKHKERIIMLV